MRSLFDITNIFALVQNLTTLVVLKQELLTPQRPTGIIRMSRGFPNMHAICTDYRASFEMARYFRSCEACGKPANPD